MIITGGKYKGRKITAPDEKITRPTLSKVRMGVFNTLYSIMGDFGGKTFLDMFGGSGIMGLEALSRGFKEVSVFEKNPKACAIIKKNYESLRLKPNLKIGDSIKFLKERERDFDVIYIDPPYDSKIYEKVFPLINFETLIIAEHSTPVITKYEPLKERNYGGKIVSYYLFKP